MSVSKLESLPNEILVDLFEKYVNGIDIINAFAFQLNQRFDALIMQSRRLRFDFIGCHKDDFRVCMGLLPAYVNKIEEFALGERYTPGQVHAFLSLYPSFTMFKNLRRLYLQNDVDAVDQRRFQQALLSLPNTALHTLSLKISSWRPFDQSTDKIRQLFHIKTLKKLSIRYASANFDWSQLQEGSSNIQYLTVHGIRCHRNGLQHIFRCAPDLRYLDIDLHLIKNYASLDADAPEMDTSPRVLMLHTVLFDITAHVEADPGQLEVYFRRMPSLRRLEIKTNTLDTLDQWRMLIQTSLPFLTSFILDISLECPEGSNLSNMLPQIQTPFWKENQHFHVIMRRIERSRSRSTELSLVASDNADVEKRHESITQWYIGPDRRMDDKSSAFNRISNICLSSQSHFLLQNQYLNNVTHLFLDSLDVRLLNAITTHINCSKIQHLEVPPTMKDNLICCLLESLTNLKSLQIDLSQLHGELYSHRRRYTTVQYLIVWSYQSSFNEKDVAMIGKLFPHLEHLIIGVKELQDVSTYHTYLPRLRSLTFDCRSYNLVCDADDEELWSYNTVRKAAKFLFQQKQNWFTIWIDQAALHDSFWRKPRDNDTPVKSSGSSLMKRMVNRLSTLFK